MRTIRRTTTLVAGAAAALLTLSACGGDSDPLEQDTGDSGEDTASDTIVVGSQAYYSNEIIAEIYAQALEADGFTVERNFSIGQRDAYMPALENGEVQVIPEYTGNLLQYFDPETTATSAEDVYAELANAVPESLAVLEQSPATDQDSYNVTADFAESEGLTSIGDLAGIDGLTVGGPAELEERPYGPQGLADVYGVDVAFEATGDTTVQDLVAGTVDVANVFSADPRIQTEDLVTLEDPEGLFLASNVVPLVGADVVEDVAAVIDPVSAALTPEGLVDLNVQSTEEQRSSEDIAADWLAENGLA
ncbi:ABC transporter substrate-binding protein [Isoptericola chiayiensis]|uniref:ABC transporter substrate-binding protein n=1 Tax=Isoptericola chiayiensis TaxID=579446 RepID=A0ABP8Y0Y0_9MICO|nr:ABC transporter substrate-binding protein [Isoptericola chiayiensis]NOW01172.1 osmoprotectant transport system substrate-binding protein [Isoptericola chiayiensis]